MTKGLENPSIFKKAVIVVFLSCLVYWVYLIFASRILLSHDAIDYEELGLMIYKQGWVEYFKTGPHREPLYPLSIAVSMKIADIFSVSYQLVQKVIQVIILFLTQILMFKLLNKLRISNRIKLIIILYFGFSPAIVNSALSLFSEIIVYPFILAAVLLGVKSWRAIYNFGFRRIALLSFSTALLFAFAAFGKGIFIYVFPFFLIPFFGTVISSIRRLDKVILSRSIIYIVVAILTFNSLIIPFKLMNKKFNGHFEFTDRYVSLLFGNAAKRTNPLTSRILLAHLASIPGRGACSLFFSEEECRSCEFLAADDYIEGSLTELLENTPEDEIKSKTLSLTFERVLKNLPQYFMFAAIESLRMPFWESTQIGFVGYPYWLEKVFSFKVLKDGLRLLTGIITFLALFYTIALIYKNRIKLFRPYLIENEDLMICFFVSLIILSYTGLHSLFSVLTRYALIIAPLYLILIAYFVYSKMNFNFSKRIHKLKR